MFHRRSVMKHSLRCFYTVCNYTSFLEIFEIEISDLNIDSNYIFGIENTSKIYIKNL